MGTRVEPARLASLQHATEHIRNICILAHVDHGKTSLADSLVCSNGIISPKLAGKLRFLDSTEDEQKRGITMQSSSISLLFSMDKPSAETDDYLINLVDSPGHIDFSSDVSTATRLCDGCLIVIDVLEGICSQTHAVLHKALRERLHPCIVLNKIDRLILELRLTPVEAFSHLQRVVVEVNALAASLLDSELRLMEEKSGIPYDDSVENPLVATWSFAPEKGNVIFASALDCWGFSIAKFAAIWAKKLNINKNVLQKYMFDNYGYNPSTKKITQLTINEESALKPIFVVMVLEPLWQMYDVGVIQNNPEKAAKMAKRGLDIELLPREVNVRDPRSTIQCILRKWMPLADAVLRMIVRCVPHPIVAQSNKAESLMQDGMLLEDSESSVLTKCREIANDIRHCVVVSDNVVLFITKMIRVHKSDLRSADASKIPVDQDEAFLALARVYSGTLKPSSRLCSLARNHDPLNIDNVTEEMIKGVAFPECDTFRVVPENCISLYIPLGPSVFPVSEVPAGNIVAVYGLEDYILKTGTMASSWCCYPLRAITFQSKPMLQVAVEPLEHFNLSKLEQGLQQLYLYDPAVEIGVNSTGQSTITCLGELHLELCMKALTEQFAKCELQASEPLVQFRETVISNSAASLSTLPSPWKETPGLDTAKRGVCRVVTSGVLAVTLRCCNLPLDVAVWLEGKSNECAHMIDKYGTTRWTEEDTAVSRELTHKLNSTSEIDSALTFSADAPANALLDRLVCIGPQQNNTNMLLLGRDCCVSMYNGEVADEKGECDAVVITELVRTSEAFLKLWTRIRGSIISGFQMASSGGPMMQEPLYATCFVIESIDVSNTASVLDGIVDEVNSEGLVTVSMGQFIANVKDGIRLCMLSSSMRVVEPMYRCSLQCDQTQLGNLYGVLSRRRGDVIGEDIIEGTSLFLLTAILPVVDSFGFAQELLKKTSGSAITPLLAFSHWSIMEEDPFWKPTTEEEKEDHGDIVYEKNLPRTIIEKVRKRKGLVTEEKIVVFAEKQRTLTKMK